jgi:HEPN domain-containing protein
VQVPRNKVAYYSIGESVETTRFYFADLAVQEALYIAAGKVPKTSSIGNSLLETYQKNIVDTVLIMSAAISSLLKNYIQSRRNRPR